MPEEPPWTRKLSPRGEAAAGEDVAPHGEEGLAETGGGHPVHAGRNRQGVVLVGERVLGVAAAGEEGADPVAELPARAARADGGDLARRFEAGQVGGAGRRRVGAGALERVGSVDARRHGRGSRSRRLRASARGGRRDAGPRDRRARRSRRRAFRRAGSSAFLWELGRARVSARPGGGYPPSLPRVPACGKRKGAGPSVGSWAARRIVLVSRGRRGLFLFRLGRVLRAFPGPAPAPESVGLRLPGSLADVGKPCQPSADRPHPVDAAPVHRQRVPPPASC